MRSEHGWLIWWWNFGSIDLGLDLSAWGFGWIFTFRHPRGFGINLGPFYLNFDFENILERLRRVHGS